MSIHDISDHDILSAIGAGFDTIGMLADHFDIPASGALVGLIHNLAHDGYIIIGTPGAAGVSRLHLVG